MHQIFRIQLRNDVEIPQQPAAAMEHQSLQGTANEQKKYHNYSVGLKKRNSM